MSASKVIAFIFGGLFSVAVAAAPAAQGKTVAGWVDKIEGEGKNAKLVGWACAVGNSEATTLEIYLDGAEGKGKKALGKFVTNLANEAAVDKSCGTSAGGKHRFKIPVSDFTKSKARQAVYVYGVSGTTKVLLPNSGNIKTPCE